MARRKQRDARPAAEAISRRGAKSGDRKESAVPEPAGGWIERGPTVRPVNWTPRLVALLGKRPDPEVARLARCSLDAVRGERRRRGIAPVRPGRRLLWTEEMIALLGTDSDGRVAAELGLPEPTVFSKRQRLGIPSHNPPKSAPAGFQWTQAAIELLGTATDEAVARRLRLPRYIVNYQRTKRGIPAFQPSGGRIAWSEEMIELLGRRGDAEVARRFGISAAAVRQERWRRGIPRHRPWGKIQRTAALARLLELPTHEIGRRTGLPEATVWRLRREHGIPSPGHSRGGPAPARWSERELALLDQLSIADVVRLTGRSEGAVRACRRRRASSRGL